jgi:hypothetical protein
VGLVLRNCPVFQSTDLSRIALNAQSIMTSEHFVYTFSLPQSFSHVWPSHSSPPPTLYSTPLPPQTETKTSYASFKLLAKSPTLTPLFSSPSASLIPSPSFLTRHCHPHSTGRKLQRSNSGHNTSKNTICVFSWTCHNRKSLRRLTPEVRISMSTGGEGRVEMSGSFSVMGRVEGRRGGLEVYM